MAWAGDKVRERCSLVDSALDWSGIEDGDGEMLNGEKDAADGPVIAVGDKLDIPPKPCGAAARGNILLFEREAANEGGDVVNRGGGDDMV